MQHWRRKGCTTDPKPNPPHPPISFSRNSFNLRFNSIMPILWCIYFYPKLSCKLNIFDKSDALGKRSGVGRDDKERMIHPVPCLNLAIGFLKKKWYINLHLINPFCINRRRIFGYMIWKIHSSDEDLSTHSFLEKKKKKTEKVWLHTHIYKESACIVLNLVSLFPV